MMISSFRKSLCHEEAGQAIILGAVSLLVLAVGIMTTAQLGWAIKEKIQLQHAADNAAYSSAAMVARSLNFISWTNRAMISQYVSAMALQSYMTFFEAITVQIAQMAASLLSAAFLVGTVGLILMATVFLFPLGSLMNRTIAPALGKAGDAIKEAANAVRDLIVYLDKPLAIGVQTIEFINKWGSYLLMQKGLGQLYVTLSFGSSALNDDKSFYKQALKGTAGEGINEEPIVGIGGLNLDYDQLNVLALNGYNNLFAGGILPNLIPLKEDLTEDQNKRSKKLMTQLVNASREGKGNVKWETKREFGVGKIIDLIFGGGEYASDLLNGIFPNTVGASMLVSAIESSGDGKGVLGEDFQAESAGKKNPLFNYNKYFSPNGQTLPVGDALVTADYTLGAGSGLPSWLRTALDWMSIAGETIPRDKLVGIQATSDSDKRFHCRYLDVQVAPDAPTGSCDDVCKNDKESCESKCQEVCPNDNYVLDENNQPTETCAVSMEWRGVSSEDDENCKRCGQVAESEEDSSDCPAAKTCREALQKAAEAANNAAEEISQGLTGGAPVRVVIRCEKENFHKFSGITPYVSFNIEDYRDRQQDPTREEYPTFFAAAHKNPTFMKEGALGFGEKFKSNNFTFNGVGVVEGVTSKDVGNCDSEFEPGCVEGGYNFNQMENDDVKFAIPGFHAWARAQAYYHRPGAWAEPPNLFNPYWKAKLSPIAPIFSNGANGLDNFGAIGGLISNAISSVVSTILSH